MVHSPVTQSDLGSACVSGEWTMQGRTLASSLGTYARFQLPYEPPEEYDLLVRASRTSGTAFILGLGGRDPVMLTIDGSGGAMTGLESVAANSLGKNEKPCAGN